MRLVVKTCVAQEVPPVYPRITGYFSVIHPIFTFYPDKTVTNFQDSYTVGFPTGVNILKSDKIGFSFEITPFIKAENGSSKVSFLLFHPGVIFRFKKGFSIATRVAFESTGRYGFTTIFNKVLIKGKSANLYGAMPIPVRLCNDVAGSVGLGLQFGVSF